MKHYLVMQLARFGDLIQSKRLVATLMRRDTAVVHLCVDNSLKSLAEIVYPEAVVHAVAAHGTGVKPAETVRTLLLGNLPAFAELRQIEFSEVFNLNFSPLNFRLAALFDPEIVHGYTWRNGQELVDTWPSMAMRWSRNRRIGLNLVDFWAGYCRDMIPAAQVNPEATPKGGGIGVVLAGRESRRSLPPEVMARITATLVARDHAPQVVLLGGQSERAAGKAMMRELPPRVQAVTRNLAGQTDWAGLVEVVGSLDMVITPDTGTMHLAAHLGTPVLAFFLSSAWCFETGPYGMGHTVYQAQAPCLPCLETVPCEYGVKCLSCFDDPGFPRFLTTGKAEHCPDGLTAFHSGFDDLGMDFTPFAGTDSERKTRQAFRKFLADYLGQKWQAGGQEPFSGAERIFQARDWMGEAEANGYRFTAD